MANFEKLAFLLQSLPAGSLSDGAETNVANLLADCWDELEGSNVSKMEYWKLVRDGGPQEMTWSPPTLSFIIDRHGGMALGSTRAEKQQWTLDMEKRTVHQSIAGYRQVRPRAATLNVKTIADDVCNAVREGPRSKSALIIRGILVWKDDDHFVVYQGKLVPNDSFKRTIAGRRKRLREALEAELGVLGWKLVEARRFLTFKKH
jgi:hypothetical protein